MTGIDTREDVTDVERRVARSRRANSSIACTSQAEIATSRVGVTILQNCKNENTSTYCCTTKLSPTCPRERTKWRQGPWVGRGASVLSNERLVEGRPRRTTRHPHPCRCYWVTREASKAYTRAATVDLVNGRHGSATPATLFKGDEVENHGVLFLGTWSGPMRSFFGDRYLPVALSRSR